MPVLFDAAPLIYFAKLDALDVLDRLDARTTSAVVAETTGPRVAYRYPDAAAVAAALRLGRIQLTEVEDVEAEAARQLQADVGGLHDAEAQILAVAANRQWSVCAFERQALRLADVLGVVVVSPLELLIDHTEDEELAEQRVIRFAALVHLRETSLREVLNVMERRRQQ